MSPSLNNAMDCSVLLVSKRRSYKSRSVLVVNKLEYVIYIGVIILVETELYNGGGNRVFMFYILLFVYIG